MQALTSQQRYLPFGEERAIPNSPILATDFGYTGQRMLDSGMGGIMDYKARFYSPMLGRFLQADTIIPNPANPQAFNRYSYVLGNPLRYTDPSGHYELCDDEPSGRCKTADDYLKEFGVATKGLKEKEKWDLFVGLVKVGNELLRIYRNNCKRCESHSAQSIFGEVFGPISITRTTKDNAYCTAGSTITCGSRARITPRLLAHEFGHILNNRANDDPYTALENASILDENGNWVTGKHYDEVEGVFEWDRSMLGYGSGCAPYTYHGRCEVNGKLVWEDWNSVGEEFADMFLNWSYNSFVGDAGTARYDWMERRMWGWLSTSLTP